MEEILSKRHQKRAFFIISFLIVCAYVLFRFFLIPLMDEKEILTFAKFLGILSDTFIASYMITIIIGCFVWFLTPKKHFRSTIEVIEPKAIGHLLKSSAFTSKKWIYKGTCGRFTRSTTLPIMAKSARNDSLGRSIDIYLLNPLNRDICKEYATYRSGLKSGSKKFWTLKMVQEEILATTISALKYKQCEPLLNVNLYYLDNFSSFRFDISDQTAMMTKEDPAASALLASNSSYFYDSYLEDIRVISSHCEKINLSNDCMIDLDTNLKTCCAEFIISDYFKFDVSKFNIDYNLIACKVNEPIDPYS